MVSTSISRREDAGECVGLCDGFDVGRRCVQRRGDQVRRKLELRLLSPAWSAPLPPSGCKSGSRRRRNGGADAGTTDLLEPQDSCPGCIKECGVPTPCSYIALCRFIRYHHRVLLPNMCSSSSLSLSTPVDALATQYNHTSTDPSVRGPTTCAMLLGDVSTCIDRSTAQCCHCGYRNEHAPNCPFK